VIRGCVPTPRTRLLYQRARRGRLDREKSPSKRFKAMMPIRVAQIGKCQNSESTMFRFCGIRTEIVELRAFRLTLTAMEISCPSSDGRRSFQSDRINVDGDSVGDAHLFKGCTLGARLARPCTCSSPRCNLLFDQSTECALHIEGGPPALWQGRSDRPARRPSGRANPTRHHEPSPV